MRTHKYKRVHKRTDPYTHIHKRAHIHFCSSGHSEDDIAIMPIEEVSLEEGECLSLASK